METRSDDIYRMKGILSIQDSAYRYVYQVRGGGEGRGEERAGGGEGGGGRPTPW